MVPTEYKYKYTKLLHSLLLPNKAYTESIDQVNEAVGRVLESISPSIMSCHLYSDIIETYTPIVYLQ